MQAGSELRWTISQIGARQHYAIPKGLCARGTLRRLYTDIWVSRGRSFLKRMPAGLRALASRYAEGVPADKVTSFNLGAMLRQARFPSHGTVDERYRFYEAFGQWFGRRVLDGLQAQDMDRSRDIFWGFTTGALECVQHCKQQGILTVVDQIDPGRVEEEIVLVEAGRFPGWSAVGGRIPDSYYQRLDAEWQSADLVMVNSTWSKDGLVKQGVAPAKIFIVPIIYEPRGEPPVKQRHDRKLTVLWLGQVNLRKGIQYVLPAAQALPGVRFVIAGPVDISDQAIKQFPMNVEFAGRLTRDRTNQAYREADVFILPTLSDGFAITQLEAMAQGLPVITTPNCGQVVSDGVDGVIVAPADGLGLAAAISRFDQDRAFLESASAAAGQKVKLFGSSRCIDLIEREVLAVLGKR